MKSKIGRYKENIMRGKIKKGIVKRKREQNKDLEKKNTFSV